ncbi:MAG: metalloregulator ArsR/SmtB family transcription factor [Betaproteobacteria bacterium]
MKAPARIATPTRQRHAARPAASSSDELAPVFDAVAEYFGLLAEPTRLAILHTICNDERSVSAIVAATGATQTNVSRHLGLLHAAGVVSRRRDGSSVLYRVADPVFVEICRSACVRIAARIDAQSPLAGDLLDYARHA